MLARISMKLKPIIFFICFLACDSPKPQVSSRNAPDSVILKIGDGHENGPDILDFQIAVIDFETQQPYTRLYSDSLYYATVISKRPEAKFIPIALADNVQIDYLDNQSLIRTGASDPKWESSKVRIGYISDTNANIIYYHHRKRDENDSTLILEHIERVDTLGYIEYHLHKKPE